MILAILGSRFFQDYPYFKKVVLKTVNIRSVSKIVSGVSPTYTGPGADSLAVMLASYYNILYEGYPAKWVNENGKYDKSAGIKRNITIIDQVDEVIAFWDGRTEHCGTYFDINYCKQINKKCHVIKIGSPDFKENLEILKQREEFMKGKV